MVLDLFSAAVTGDHDDDDDMHVEGLLTRFRGWMAMTIVRKM